MIYAQKCYFMSYTLKGYCYSMIVMYSCKVRWALKLWNGFYSMFYPQLICHDFEKEKKKRVHEIYYIIKKEKHKLFIVWKFIEKK